MADCILAGNDKRINAGGGAYVTDGLIVNDVNLLGRAYKTETFPSLTLNNCTIEIYYSASAIQGYGGLVGRLFIFAGQALLLNAGQLGTGSDYGLQTYYEGEYNTTALTAIDGLTFGTKHTYTVVQSGSRTNVYFDGTLVDGYDNAGGRTSIIGTSAIFIDASVYPLTGTWYNARVYNRALTAAEILANHNEDVNQYGS